MKIIYILFFMVLNLLIHAHLVKKLRIGSRTKIWMSIFLFTAIILHFITPIGISILNEWFFILICFSIVLFIFHYGRNFVLWLYPIRDKRAVTWYGIWIDYIPYVMTFIFQVKVIIENPPLPEGW